MSKLSAEALAKLRSLDREAFDFGKAGVKGFDFLADVEEQRTRSF